MIEVRDNFLSSEELQFVKDTILSDTFPLFWNDRVIEQTGDEPHLYYLTHVLFEMPMGANSPAYSKLFPIFEQKMKVKALQRMKVNFYPHSYKLYEHGYHFDKIYPHKGALFSLNTCDGYTKFETGEQIESVENRMMFFDPSISHTSSNTTNAKRRININFNYF